MKYELKRNYKTTLQTDRLELRPWKIEYAEDMFKNWATDKEVSKFLSWEPHKNIEETRNIFSKWAGEEEYNWCIFDKSINEAVGCINVTRRQDINYFCEIGYCSSRKVWNKGYMTEALKAVLDFLFKEGYCKVSLRHAIPNVASGRVMQKAGMTLEGVTYCSSYVKGVFYDCNVYYKLNPYIQLDRKFD